MYMSQDYKWRRPLEFASIGQEGAVSPWYRELPEAKVIVGDGIIRVVQIGWDHNSRIFLECSGEQIDAAKEMRFGVSLICK